MPKLAEKKTTETGCKLCPKFTQTFMMLGKKWNGLIIEVLLEQPTLRFKDIAGAITKCSDRVLCERLKELEDELGKQLFGSFHRFSSGLPGQRRGHITPPAGPGSPCGCRASPGTAGSCC